MREKRATDLPPVLTRQEDSDNEFRSDVEGDILEGVSSESQTDEFDEESLLFGTALTSR